MLAILLFAMIIFSGSLIANMCGHNKIYRVVPITIMAVSVWLFVFGLLELLYIGVVALNVAVIALYVIFGIWVSKSDNRSQLKKMIVAFTVVFMFVFCVSYLDRGMLAHTWDEFSHWADVVKAMFYIDDFATNPLSRSLYKNYPPGMALIQYLYLEEQSIIHGKMYVEWRLFAAWHIIALSLLFPILDDKRPKKLESISIVLIILSLCCYYYSDFFEIIYIDPAVAVVAAYVLLLILFSETKDMVYYMAVLFGCIFLCLLKDVGILFASINAVAFCFDQIKRPFASIKNAFLVVPLMSSVVIKKLWQFDVKKEGIIGAHQQNIDFLEYLKMLF